MRTLYSPQFSAAAGSWYFVDQPHFHSYFFVLWVCKSTPAILCLADHRILHSKLLYMAVKAKGVILWHQSKEIFILLKIKKKKNQNENLKQGLQVKLFVSY